MSERARRNEIPEHEMIPGAEILVRAEFREDENDDGFTTTRWASLDELATADKNEIEEALDGFETWLAHVRQLLLEEPEAQAADAD